MRWALNDKTTQSPKGRQPQQLSSIERESRLSSLKELLKSGRILVHDGTDANPSNTKAVDESKGSNAAALASVLLFHRRPTQRGGTTCAP